MANITERIRREMGQFTRTERRIAHVLLSSYPAAGLETVAQFAGRAETSGPSILRFIGKIGFGSYAEFQQQLRAEVTAVMQSPLTRSRGDKAEGDSAQDTTGVRISEFGSRTIENMTRALELLDEATVEAVTSLLAEDRRPVYLIGGRFSRANALWTYQFLREMRPRVHLVDGQPSTWVDHLVDLDRRSVLIVFDYRRYQADVKSFTEQAVARKATVIAVTDEWMSPAAALADHVITAPVAVPSLFDSTLPSLMQMEAIIARLGERLGSRGHRRIAEIEQARSNQEGPPPPYPGPPGSP
ncbi:MurR/RpiR family transcriptional regulator [Fodinicurvata sediminis]|uniref:MurR/RpiR family transcriptional regulator n=1 Tax=Fodinicurvata sediminis TaxID=1121832 RepID=UPI0003B763B7|nr:MurR/RpiR family transcriptional regulator [Fodinicurvata sediminis]